MPLLGWGIVDKAGNDTESYICHITIGYPNTDIVFEYYRSRSSCLRLKLKGPTKCRSFFLSTRSAFICLYIWLEIPFVYAVSVSLSL